MEEYIPREAALGFMNEVEPCICRNPDGVVFTAAKDNDMLEYLRSIPAAGVVPVVRCGECKYWTESSAIPLVGCCAFTPMKHTAEFFCANGERKDGDGE